MKWYRYILFALGWILLTQYLHKTLMFDFGIWFMTLPFLMVLEEILTALERK